MPFADLHLHPTLKTQFSDAPDKFSVDEKVIPDVVLNEFVRLCSDMEDVIESQANIRQLVENKVKLVCLALYAPEPEIIGNKNLVDAIKKDPSAKRYISGTRLNAFRDGLIAPFEFTRDYELATALSINIPDLGKIIPLKKTTVIDDNGAKNVYAVFSIEGCHSLLDSFDDYKSPATLALVITTNLQELLDTGVPIISVNLTHLVDYPLCTHAFGMQFLYNKGFFPKGNGLSEAAKDVALYCYNKNIHIDIKHLSIKSRMDLYRLKVENGFMDFPVICTHAGFAGISRKQYPNYIYKLVDDAADYYYLEVCKPRGWLDQTSFNANTISLYDEDIAEILRTRGIIGISLDKRIIGYTDPRVSHYHLNDIPDQLLEIDYFSYQEYIDPFLYGNNTHYGGKTDNNNCLFRNEIDTVLPTGASIRILHFRHLVNHFIHVYKVAAKEISYTNGLDPLDAVKKHLCIGSDFDGLINPVSCAYSVEDMTSLQIRFTNDFQSAFEEGAGITITSNDAKTIIDNFFYNNAKRYITNWVAAQP